MIISLFQHFSHLICSNVSFTLNMEAAFSSETTEQTHVTRCKNKNLYLYSIRYRGRKIYKVTLSLCLTKNNRRGTGNWKRKH